MFIPGLITFIPKQFSNLALWLDASNPSNNGTRPADGTLIDTWVDVSGLGNTFTSSGGLRPTYKTGIQNNLPVMRFGGANSMSLADTSTLDLTSGFTLFHVSKLRINNNGIILEKRDSGGNFGWQHSLILPVGGSGGMQYCADPIGGGLCVYSNVSFSTGTFYLFCLDVNSTATNMYRNTINDYTQASNYIPDDIASSDIYLGSYRAGSSFLDGDIAELILYNASLSSAQIAIVNEYLRRKWAIY